MILSYNYSTAFHSKGYDAIGFNVLLRKQDIFDPTLLLMSYPSPLIFLTIHIYEISVKKIFCFP